MTLTKDDIECIFGARTREDDGTCSVRMSESDAAELRRLAHLGAEREGARGVITFNTVDYEWDAYSREDLQAPASYAALGIVEFFRELRIYHLTTSLARSRLLLSAVSCDPEAVKDCIVYVERAGWISATSMLRTIIDKLKGK